MQFKVGNIIRIIGNYGSISPEDLGTVIATDGAYCDVRMIYGKHEGTKQRILNTYLKLWSDIPNDNSSVPIEERSFNVLYFDHGVRKLKTFSTKQTMLSWVGIYCVRHSGDSYVDFVFEGSQILNAGP